MSMRGDRALTSAFMLVAVGLMAVPHVQGAITPYLQTPTQTSIHVCWQSTTAGAPFVHFGASALNTTAAGTSEQLGTGVVWHDVALTGLVPATLYSYRCVQGTDSSAVFTFMTPPAASVTTGHIRFGIISDSQEYSAQSARVVDSMRAMVMRLWGSDLSSSLALVVHCGDICSSGGVLAQYQAQYFSSMAPLSGSVPFMVSIGNHEGESAYFYKYMRYGEFGGPAGDRYYSFRYGRVQFIALNTNTQYRNETQIAWLDSICTAAEGDDTIDWIFSYGHHPALSEMWPDGNTAYTETRILPTLAKYSKTTLHCAGHTHAYERGAVQGAALHTLIFGGAGGALDRWGAYANQTDYSSVSRSHDHHGYALVDIDLASGSYTFRAFSLGSQDVTGPGLALPNTLIDSYTAWKRKLKPDKPVPSDLPDTVDLPVALTSSAYSGTRAHWSTQVQVRTAAGSFTSGTGIPVDVQRDAENVYRDSGAPLYAPVDKNTGIDLTRFILTESPALVPGRYYWRVRYRDANLDWSDWSVEKAFVIRDPALALDENRAVYFDGVASYIEVASSLGGAVLPSSAMTVEAWVRPEAFPLYGGFIGAFQDNAGSQKGWVLGTVVNHFSFGLASHGADDGNGMMTYVQDPTVAVAGQWYHVAGVYDGSQMKLIVNGVQVATSSLQTGAILYDSSSRVTIGAYRDADEFVKYKGAIDEMRLWKSALSADDIRAWMFRKMNPTHALYVSLLSCWHLDGVTGTTLTDLTGSNPGTANGFSASSVLRSTAPIGVDGSLFITQTGGYVGATGAGVQFNPVSTLSGINNLGVYTVGRAAGNPVMNDIFPPGIIRRSHLSWGFWKRGTVSGSAALRYLDLVRVAPDASLRLLYRPAVDTAWTDVTDEQYHDIPNKQFIVSGPMQTGLYAIGWDLAASVDDAGGVGVPTVTRLYQNFPNPGNPSTDVRFDLAGTGDVRLDVYSILGQRVRTLEAGTLPAGTHIRRWGLSDDSGMPVATGMYLCTLRSVTGISTIKILVVR